MSGKSTDEILPLVVNSVRAASALAAQDVDFYKSLDKEIASTLNETSQEVTDMINSILLTVDENSDELENGKEQFEESWKDLGNILDNLFELADHSIDALTKKKNNNSGTSKMKYLNDSFNGKVENNGQVSKPQLQFSKPIDNSETHPFIPLLKEKPHSIISLAESTKLVDETEDVPSHYPQPYETEIDRQEYSESVLQNADPIPSNVWEDTEAIWVDNVESLNSMLNELKTASELAVDLEHHDFRSYYGITCLMQISTRKTDYLVDTLALRDELQVLNVVFTDPKIIKVLHGAFMDIIWLQRDLGLYIVSLFDTFHASRALGFPRHSLAYLLEKFAQFKTSKQYQLADWRVRPLSKAMNAYARADTHFLLNIYDQLKNQLIKEDKLAQVLHESRKVAKRRFEYSKFRPKVPSSSVFSPTENENPWRSLIYQYNIPPQKVELVKRLWEWRDTIARRDDESPRYIMPNQLIASLAEYVPTNPAGVISVNRMMTDSVRSNAKYIANLIKNTLEDLKNNKIPTTASSFIIKTNDDASSSKNLTSSQIKFLVARYAEIVDNYNSTNSEVSSQVKDNNQLSLIFNDIFKAKNEIIAYSDDGKHNITEQQILDRKAEIEVAIKQATEKTFSIEVNEEPESEQTLIEREVEVEVSPSASNATPVFDDEEEDLDEIIVLRDIKDRGNKKLKRKHENNGSEQEAVDYSKMDKIMSQENIKKNFNKRKHDAFSADNHENAPKAAKRRRPQTKNRNVSFKR